MRNLRRIVFAVLVAALFGGITTVVFAQTNPAPFDLSAGDFFMTSWPATNAAGTYPSNMAFHRSNTQDPGLGIEMTADFADVYNKTSGSRINGLDDSGISFVNIGSSGNIGAAAAAINTVGRANVGVTFTCQLLAQGDGSPVPREYAIRLQYRVGAAGTWTDAPGPAEYSSAGKAVNHQATIGPVYLPIEANNQSVVYLRWKYYSAAANNGGQRPRIRLDDIFVTSVSTLGTPANFAIGSITPASPSTTSSFSVTVQSVDGGGNPAAVSQNTTFSLSVAAGSGVLSGTTSGTITAGNTSVIISGINYNVAESNVRIAASRISGDNLSAGTSAPFSVGVGATGQAFVGLQTVANAGKALRTFTVEARRSDGTLDASYQGNVTIAIATGAGTLNGTKTKTLVNGAATFNDISFANAGTYTLSASAQGLSQATSTTITVSPPVAMASISIPQYIKSTTNTARIPSFALMRFDNLLPNTQYRYYTGICSTAVEPGAGAGNNIHYYDETGTFATTSAKSHISTNTPPDYSSFTTGSAETSKTLWVNIVTTGNARFSEGANVYWRVIMTDTPGFPCDTLTSNITSKTLEFGQFSTNATGIYDSISTMQPKNYAVFYDNINGSGNPVTVAVVEGIGAAIRTSPTTGPAPFFEQLESMNGSWATLIPNNLTGGVRRIEERSPNGSLVRYWTDEDGNWAGVNTVNPFAGLSPAINFKTPQIMLVTAPSGGSAFCANGSGIVSWVSRGVKSAQLELLKGSETPVLVAANIDGFTQTYQWTISGITDSSKLYQIRITDLEHETVFGASAVFSIYLPPTIIQEPPSINTCVGDNIRLITQARGTGLKYQWQKDGSDIPGATDTTLFLNNANTLTSGLYRCVVTGLAPCSQTVTRIATVFVTPPIQILKQPQYKPAAIGSRVELTVEVMGTENHKYQWRRGTQYLKNSTRISGVNSPTLIIHSFQATDEGNDYNCVVSGDLPCGTAITAVGGFRASAVQFTAQPGPTHSCIGSSAQFMAIAVSNPVGATLDYQWLHNGRLLENGYKYQGTKNSTLTVQNISVADTGSYWVEVSGPGNATVTSQRALLTVGSAAEFIEQPKSAVLCPKSDATLRAVAAGLGDVTYKWLQNDSIIPNATGDTLLITAPDSSDIRHSYRCIATTSCGSDTSATAIIEAYDKLLITEQPQKNLSVKIGDGIYLFVRYTSNHFVRFQWFKGDSIVPGAESAELRIANIAYSDSGSYRCAIIGICDTTFSDFAAVKVSAPSAVTDSDISGYYVASVAPNPATETAILRFGVGSESEVSIKLLEITGREVARQNLGALVAGEYSAKFDVSDLASGIYLCRVEANGIVRTLRISVIR